MERANAFVDLDTGQPLCPNCRRLPKEMNCSACLDDEYFGRRQKILVVKIEVEYAKKDLEDRLLQQEVCNEPLSRIEAKSTSVRALEISLASARALLQREKEALAVLKRRTKIKRDQVKELTNQDRKTMSSAEDIAKSAGEMKATASEVGKQLGTVRKHRLQEWSRIFHITLDRPAAKTRWVEAPLQHRGVIAGMTVSSDEGSDGSSGDGDRENMRSSRGTPSMCSVRAFLRVSSPLYDTIIGVPLPSAEALQAIVRLNSSESSPVVLEREEWARMAYVGPASRAALSNLNCGLRVISCILDLRLPPLLPSTSPIFHSEVVADQQLLEAAVCLDSSVLSVCSQLMSYDGGKEESEDGEDNDSDDDDDGDVMVCLYTDQPLHNLLHSLSMDTAGDGGSFVVNDSLQVQEAPAGSGECPDFVTVHFSDCAPSDGLSDDISADWEDVGQVIVPLAPASLPQSCQCSVEEDMDGAAGQPSTAATARLVTNTISNVSSGMWSALSYFKTGQD